LQDGAVLEADVGIVGAGVAGLVLARALAGRHLDVVLLESGTAEPLAIPALDALAIESSGDPAEPTCDGRARGLGGSAHLWNTYLRNRPAARFVRLDAIDFETRPGVPESGWPFSLAALETHYDEAEALVMPSFSIARQRALEASSTLGLDPARAVSVAEGFGLAALFTKHLPRQLRDDPRSRIITGATATEVLLNPASGRALGVMVSVGGARRATLSCRILVLAASTIDNVRLLLASTTERPAGLANNHDNVGRFFMEHHRLNAGHLVPNDPGLFDRTALYDLRDHGDQFWMGKIKVSPAVLRTNGWLNSSTLMWPRVSELEDRGVDALQGFIRSGRQGRLPSNPRARLQEVAQAGRYLVRTGVPLALMQRTPSPNVTRGGWSRLPDGGRWFRTFELVQQIEQSPDPENRVTLARRSDEYGMPIAHVRCRLAELDLESARLSQELLAAELEHCGAGRVVRPPGAPFPDFHQAGGLHHNLGGTRMHADPKRGVVDADGKVHGVDGLYVAGGSIFPTGGYVNPTLTILALAFRLADHLGRALGR